MVLQRHNHVKDQMWNAYGEGNIKKLEEVELGRLK
jgi:hypothetical protein